MAETYKNELEEINKKINVETLEISTCRDNIANSTATLKSLRRERLEKTAIVEEWDKLIREKEKAIKAAEEGKDKDFTDFHAEAKEKVDKLIKKKGQDKIAEIQQLEDKKIEELENDSEKLKGKLEVSSENLKQAIKTEDEVNNRLSKIKKRLLNIKSLKQKLARYKKLVEIARNRNEQHKVAFYLIEMGKTIDEIGTEKTEMDIIATELTKKKLEEAQEKYDDAKKVHDEFLKKYEEEKDNLETYRKNREANILAEIEKEFPKRK